MTILSLASCINLSFRNQQHIYSILGHPAPFGLASTMNFVRPLPMLFKEKIVLFTAVECFLEMTRFILLRPNLEARKAVILLKNLVYRIHGLLENIVSENDLPFSNNLWKSHFSNLGTKLSLSSVYDLQTDVQSETMNCKAENTIRSIVSFDRSSRDE